jgi:hypothetical protein
MKLEFSQQFLKKIQISDFIKICLVGSELCYADGQMDRRTDRRTDGRTDRQTDRQTDRHGEANSHFSQFCRTRLKM